MTAWRTRRRWRITGGVRRSSGALAVGEGRGMRKSTTSAEHTFYYAMRLSDGNVLRIGKESGSTTIWHGI